MNDENKAAGSRPAAPTCSAGSDTPEVDKQEAWLYENRPDQYTVDSNRIELAKRLERQRNSYAATIREFLGEADDFAETRRGYLRFLRLADELDTRHPELSEPNKELGHP